MKMLETILPPPNDDTEEDLNPPELLSKAEKVALEFHADCISALDGEKISAGNFVLSPEFREIKRRTIAQVGDLFYTIASDWFVDNKNLFI